MSNKIVRIDQLSDEVKKLIDEMNESAIQQCNESARKAAQEGASKLRQTSPVRNDGYQRKNPPGSYAKSWTYKKVGNFGGVNTYVIHNAKHYQLTHLLEYGHIIKQTGKRSVVRKHIADVNESASERFVQLVREMKF